MALTINPSTFAITSSGQIHGAIVITSDTKVGASTLSAAGFVGGVLSRSGSVADYTDTTPTATDILAAIPSATIGTSFTLRVINTTAFKQSISAGIDVTLSGSFSIVGYGYVDLVGVFTAITSPALTLTNIGFGTVSTKRIWRGVMIQSGASAPTVGAIYENSIGAIAWTYDSQGIFIGTLSNAFAEGKTFITFNLGNNTSDDVTCNAAWNSTSTIYIRTFLAGALTNSLFGYANLTIEVYP